MFLSYLMNQFPLPFYLSLAAMIVFGYRAFRAVNYGWGLPVLAVLATVATWYHVDVLYNDYGGYVEEIGIDHVTRAWWQVGLFILAFGLLTPFCHKLFNRRLLHLSSSALLCYRTNFLQSGSIQSKLDLAAKTLGTLWFLMMIIGLYLVDWRFLDMVAPYVTGQNANPWSGSRIASGFSSFLALAGYIQIFLAAAFGVIFAISRNPKTRVLAAIVCLCLIPSYVFDRTRNTMLATVIPGLLSYVFFRMQGSLWKKGAVLGVSFFVVNFWMAFVLNERSEGNIATIAARGEVGSLSEDARHGGLNMFEELAWIDKLTSDGTFQPETGKRYFAELVNPIPRGLWSGKPLIGIDYAVARGQKETDDANAVTATISTGMIGQGVTNFGGFFGPVAAAGIMALWCAILARQDLLARFELSRLLLFAIGLILTFNLGRDITLLVLYPFFFGLAIIWAAATFFTGRTRQIDPLADRLRQEQMVRQQRGTPSYADSNLPPE